MRHLHFVLFLIVCSCVSTRAADRPNVVWLVSEDNSTHYLKMFDPHGAPTPRIAELAKHGLLYEHAFSNAPVCSVARTTLATGCYGPRIGTQFHRKSVQVPLPDGVRMFPEYLRKAGYYTANVRKTDYNAIPGKQVWDDSSAKSSWRNRSEDQPFFFMKSFSVCHESSLHFTKQQMEKQKTVTDPDTVFVAPYHPDTPTFRYTNARYRDNIMEMDRQVGQVVDQLTEDGLLEDTFIFYFGDHGGVLPRGKGYAYESGLHVPLVVRIPDNWKHLVDAKMNSRLNGFVSFIDFGPTVLNLVGLPVPDGVDGRPFLGKNVTQQEVESRDEAFGYADRFDEKYDLVRTLRKGRYEYIRNFQPFNFDGLQNNYRYKMLAFQEWRELFQANKLNDVQSQFFRSRPAEQLFDIESDPHETKNLANDPEYSDVLNRLRKRMTERLESMPDLSLFPESILVDGFFENPVLEGQDARKDVSQALEVANLSVLPWSEAGPQLNRVFSDRNPLLHYWGLVALSSHGKAAKEFIPAAKKLASSSPQGLVRVRAAEFLGLVGAEDPAPVIIDALRNSKSGIEAGLILNSVALLQDGPHGYDFNLKGVIAEEYQKNDTVKRRLEYLLAP